VTAPAEKIIDNIKSHYASLTQQRQQLDLLKKMNEIETGHAGHEAVLDARIQSFELAFKMQTEATDVFDVSKEPQSIRDMYGDSETARRMLVARRLVENGVRCLCIVRDGDWRNGFGPNQRR